MRPLLRLLVCCVLCAPGLTACDDESPAEPAEWPLDTLSAYGFFQGPLRDLSPAEGVVPYQVIAPLWADHAGKARFIVLPEGGRVTHDGTDEGWAFPEGTVVIKNFWYSTDRRQMEATAKVVETRLLIRQADGWTGHTYVWDDAQTEATRVVAGKRLILEFTDEAGQAAQQVYRVPNTNQCDNCHEIDDELRLLGISDRQLARPVTHAGQTVGQLAFLAERLPGAPAATTAPLLVDPAGDAPLDQRARSYLDANCSHCHRPGGDGGSSGLVLLASETRPAVFGVCKSPVAAGPGADGRRHAISPGHPEASIMVFRMSTTDPELKMPEIPNLVVDDFGVRLISAWIQAMDHPPCD